MLTRVEADRGRSVDRLVTFTDAIVAIAITLLALPLVDLPREFADQAVRAHPGATLDPGPLLGEMLLPTLGFVISFFVIARLWWAHHRIFEHVVRWSGLLVWLTIAWLFTVVVLSIATAITTTFEADDHPGVVAIYIGTMLVSSLLLTTMSVVVLRDPGLTDGRDAQALRRAIGSAETSFGFAIALAIGVLIPVVNYYALLVLVLTGRFDGPLVRRLERRRGVRRQRTADPERTGALWPSEEGARIDPAPALVRAADVPVREQDRSGRSIRPGSTPSPSRTPPLERQALP